MNLVYTLLLQIQQLPQDTAGLMLDADGNPITKEETISIWELIVQGGWYIMIPLGIMSLMSVYIFVERYFAIKKASVEKPDFMAKIKDNIHDGKIDAALHLCEAADTPMARITAKGISRIGKPTKDIAATIENVAKLEVYNLEKNLSSLATIAGAAPMIGFLGTVIGMIVTFHEMKISDKGVEIAELSGGIMQAMVTTVAGLVIGIVAYIAYNSLVAFVNKVVNKLEISAIEFLDLLDEPSK
ncbi:MotA/TolQ/ExbB proton channel family protein [Luteibaculum oceani]|nr:MotA/TolQ/ExbB proton channel family protein [Luteibaculum oceani]